MQMDLLQKELLSALQDAKSASPENDIEPVAGGDDKAPEAFKTISEVADMLGVPQHVLRFWESRFPQIRPLKLRGGRRYYRPEDVVILSTIKHLLYKQGYTIKGAKKAFSQLGKVTRAANAATATAAPAATATPKETPSAERRVNQLSVIRQELITMRDILKTHLT